MRCKTRVNVEFRMYIFSVYTFASHIHHHHKLMFADKKETLKIQEQIVNSKQQQQKWKWKYECFTIVFSVYIVHCAFCIMDCGLWIRLFAIGISYNISYLNNSYFHNIFPVGGCTVSPHSHPHPHFVNRES